MLDQDREEMGPRKVFWLFDRGQGKLVSEYGSLYLPELQTSADVLAALLCIGRAAGRPMPEGVFEDLRTALEELYGRDVFWAELVERGSGSEGIELRHLLNVEDLETYFANVAVPAHRNVH